MKDLSAVQTSSELCLKCESAFAALILAHSLGSTFLLISLSMSRYTRQADLAMRTVIMD